MVCFADFEFTHAPKRKWCDLIQAGIIYCDDSVNVIGEHEYFVRPKHLPVTHKITKLTGITTAMVKDACTMRTAARLLIDTTAKADRVITYGHSDRRMLETNKRYIPEEYVAGFDTFLDKIEPYQLRRMSLAKCCGKFCVVNERPHSALSDARALREVYIRIHSLSEEELAEVLVQGRKAYKRISGIEG